MCWQQIPQLVLATQVEQMEQIVKIVFTHAVLKKELSCCLKLKAGVWLSFSSSFVVEFLVMLSYNLWLEQLAVAATTKY